MLYPMNFLHHQKYQKDVCKKKIKALEWINMGQQIETAGFVGTSVLRTSAAAQKMKKKDNGEYEL